MANITKYQTTNGVRYRVRYRKPDGTQTDKRGFKRKIDAENWAAEHVTIAKATGGYIDPQAGKTTVGLLAEAWLAKKKTSVKASTYRPLEITWRVHVAPVWGNVPVSKIAREDIQQWVTSLSEQRSPTVVIRAHGILAGILDDAKNDKRIGDNPARNAELPRKRSRPHRYLTAEQLYRLADCAGWRHDIILTLGLCGMRWGELVPLRVKDVDLDKHRINIGVSAPMVGMQIIADDTKTYRTRSIMYPSVLDEIMRKHCDGRATDNLVFEAPGRPGEMIREHGNATARSDSWMCVAMRRAGIEGRIRIHDLRHTAASLMVHAGANVKAVQRQLGHSSAAMTLDVYADLFDDDLDELSARMGDMLLRENVGKMWANNVCEAS